MYEKEEIELQNGEKIICCKLLMMGQY